MSTSDERRDLQREIVGANPKARMYAELKQCSPLIPNASRLSMSRWRRRKKDFPKIIDESTCICIVFSLMGSDLQKNLLPVRAKSSMSWPSPIMTFRPLSKQCIIGEYPVRLIHGRISVSFQETEQHFWHIFHPMPEVFRAYCTKVYRRVQQDMKIFVLPLGFQGLNLPIKQRKMAKKH